MDYMYTNSFYRQWLLRIALIACFTFYYSVDKLCAQQYSWEEFVEKISTDEHDDYDYLSPLLQDLEELHHHPFNINEASAEDLRRLPFLSEKDITGILSYLYRYGDMQSLGELLLINELDYMSRCFLGLFVYVAPSRRENDTIPLLKRLLKEGRHELSGRMEIPVCEKDGYKPKAQEVLLKNPNKIYLGDRFYHNIRYDFAVANRFSVGFTAEKDAGEPFGQYGNKGYDYYGFHALLENKGVLKTVALGDYRVAAGEGLVISTDFLFSKNAGFSFRPRTFTVRRHHSVAESNHLRGAAVQLCTGSVTTSVFYSFQRVDATLTNMGLISTLKTDGMHRTLLEISKKHNVKEQVMGADVSWQSSHLAIGATAAYAHYNVPFDRGKQLYRMYYPQGKDFLNCGVHYAVRYSRFMFSGESAYSRAYAAFATQNKVVYRFNNRWNVQALQRFFDYRYVALHANAFSEGGQVKNESGFYVALDATPIGALHVRTSFDYFYFPWARFATPHSSDGYEFTIDAEQPFSKKLSASCRYSLKSKERYGVPYVYNKVKAQVQYHVSAWSDLRLMGRFSTVRDEAGDRAMGYLLSVTSKCWNKGKSLSGSLSVAYFDSPDYKIPMSIYEPSLPRTFSFHTFYGRGLRLSLLASYKVCSYFHAMAKVGSTCYHDRTEIGDGLDRIDGRWKTDVSLMAVIRL